MTVHEQSWSYTLGTGTLSISPKYNVHVYADRCMLKTRRYSVHYDTFHAYLTLPSMIHINHSLGLELHRVAPLPAHGQQALHSAL